jgi:hypothetical protein
MPDPGKSISPEIHIHDPRKRVPALSDNVYFRSQKKVDLAKGWPKNIK